jgi:hypothetical protein
LDYRYKLTIIFSVALSAASLLFLDVSPLSDGLYQDSSFWDKSPILSRIFGIKTKGKMDGQKKHQSKIAGATGSQNGEVPDFSVDMGETLNNNAKVDKKKKSNKNKGKDDHDWPNEEDSSRSLASEDLLFASGGKPSEDDDSFSNRDNDLFDDEDDSDDEDENSPRVTAVKYDKNSFTLSGEFLNEVTEIKVQGNGIDVNLEIDEGFSNENTLIANAAEELQIVFGKAYDLILSSAHGGLRYSCHIYL